MNTALKEPVGSSLMVATSIGFALTIASIELVFSLGPVIDLPCLLCALAIRPLSGVWSMRSSLTSDRFGAPAR